MKNVLEYLEKFSNEDKIAVIEEEKKCSYKELCDYTHAKGMDFTSTPFDYASADYLYEMVDFYKVSSSDLSNIPLKYIASLL